MLGRPLLVTGESGCGKTQLAYHLAWEMAGLNKPLRFDTKSTSNAHDLFYTYDAIAHFHAAQIKNIIENENRKKLSPLPFIRANALGLAILLGKDKKELEKTGLFSILNLKNTHKPQRSIVLIDEIDKAPRDFPNDILNEVEESYFTIPEINNLRIDTNEKFKPIIILTSNSEKHLPYAFLRRCVYFDINFPNQEQMEKIIRNHLGEKSLNGKPELFEDAQAFFLTLRDDRMSLRKKPGTAELLDWLWTLENFDMENKPLYKQNHSAILSSFSSLVKNKTDQVTVRNQWLEYSDNSA